MLALTTTLPARHIVGDWDVTWLGFDTMLLLSLAATGWSAWRRVAALAATSLIAAVLLFCDAWFDVMTSTNGADRAVSIVLAVVVELPLAAALASVSWRQYHRVTPTGDGSPY
jgi:hypothetical protein